MAEAVPLGGGLGVEVPGVVVDYTRFLLVDVLFENLASEEGAVAWEGVSRGEGMGESVRRVVRNEADGSRCIQ